jgi:hypothetical protein
MKAFNPGEPVRPETNAAPLSMNRASKYRAAGDSLRFAAAAAEPQASEHGRFPEGRGVREDTDHRRAVTSSRGRDSSVGWSRWHAVPTLGREG